MGSVGTGPVAVYVGSSAAFATSPMDVGGHSPYLPRSALLIAPVPPPVW
jgi:hypothetical protein